MSGVPRHLVSIADLDAAEIALKEEILRRADADEPRTELMTLLEAVSQDINAVSEVLTLQYLNHADAQAS